MTMSVNLYIPTLNGGARFVELLKALSQQTLVLNSCVVVDSGSVDGTQQHAKQAGFRHIAIPKSTFDHGGTRQLAIDTHPDADIYVFLTQDAVLADADALANLVNIFHDSQIGMAYGRQLPHHGATHLESHARLFNYPPETQVRSLADATKYGIKTISCSNSFAAYRREALQQVGGFPLGTIMGEDVIVAGKMLLEGWKMAYVGNARVHHSHNYTLREEFERYFDIGVFHRDNPWIFDSFGRADGEGFRYAKSELGYIGRRKPLLLPLVLGSFASKWMGYKLGLKYHALSLGLRRKFSMYKGYWDK